MSVEPKLLESLVEASRRVGVAFGKVMVETQDMTYVPASRLPVPKEVIKEAILITAYSFLCEGKLDERFRQTFRGSCRRLAWVVPDETAERLNAEHDAWLAQRVFKKFENDQQDPMKLLGIEKPPESYHLNIALSG